MPLLQRYIVTNPLFLFFLGYFSIYGVYIYVYFDHIFQIVFTLGRYFFIYIYILESILRYELDGGMLRNGEGMRRPKARSAEVSHGRLEFTSFFLV